MWRPVIAFVSGLVVWIIIASLLNRLLRFGLPGYLAAEPAMAFTLSMQCARLLVGAAASLAAGFTIARISAAGSRLPLGLGALLLVLFIPVHYKMWAAFPVWYHLAFLLTLVPLVVAGARIARAALPEQRGI